MFITPLAAVAHMQPGRLVVLAEDHLDHDLGPGQFLGQPAVAINEKFRIL